jgi:hypothetical protein
VGTNGLRTISDSATNRAARAHAGRSALSQRAATAAAIGHNKIARSTICVKGCKSNNAQNAMEWVQATINAVAIATHIGDPYRVVSGLVAIALLLGRD